MKHLNVTRLLLAILFCCNTIIITAQQNQITDDNITNRVETEMAWQMTLPSDQINVETKDAIVLLSGTVNNILAKERAVTLAGSIRGVRGVVDEIQVNPPKVENALLKENILGALRDNPATDSYEVDVSVDGGKVRLSGKVQSWREKHLSDYVAKGVKGVKEVQNDIQVEFIMERPYNEIKNEIEQAFRNDIRLFPNTIDVKVKGRKVWLEGTVGSVSELNLARSYALTSGVTEVDSKGLTVESWANNTNLRKKPAPVIADDKIKKAVEDAFLHDPRVISYNPTVTVQNGVVTLSGKVSNLNAKRAAEADAQNVVGVAMVKNNLKVRPNETVPNNTLEERVENALARSPDVDRYDITVRAWSGYIYLNGKVDTYFEKNKAEEIAANVKGVTKIFNNLNVYFDNEAQDYLYPYGSDDYIYPSPYSSPQAYYNYPINDLQIKDNIEDELWWSPFVDEIDVEVAVRNGVATLTGTVDSWQEKRTAVKNAYEGGAIKVVDNLSLRAAGSEN